MFTKKDCHPLTVVKLSLNNNIIYGASPQFDDKNRLHVMILPRRTPGIPSRVIDEHAIIDKFKAKSLDHVDEILQQNLRG